MMIVTGHFSIVKLRGFCEIKNGVSRVLSIVNVGIIVLVGRFVSVMTDDVINKHWYLRYI